jgi:hypothetical protein
MTLEMFHAYGKKRKWTIEQLKLAVKTSRSYRQVLVKLNLRAAGGNYDQLRKYVTEYKLSTKHFTGKHWKKGMHGIGKAVIPLHKVLRKNTYIQSFQLKKRLFIAGMKTPWCEDCGWAQRTKGGHLPLELDHINGDKHDNRLRNLRVLCPNCHSLKPTHRGRKGQV